MYSTAHVALAHRAQLQTIKTLLVTGVSGAAGSAAEQIGKQLITTTSLDFVQIIIPAGILFGLFPYIFHWRDGQFLAYLRCSINRGFSSS